MVYGEQLQTFWQLGSRVKLSAYASFYDWKYADSVAFSVLTANSASPDNGLLTLNSNGLQNSIATVTATNAITGAKTITSAQFASKFAILDSLAQLDIQTPLRPLADHLHRRFRAEYAGLRKYAQHSGAALFSPRRAIRTRATPIGWRRALAGPARRATGNSAIRAS